MLNKMVKWEKWVGPFDEENDKENSDDEDGDNWKKKSKPSQATTQTMIGPMGIIPINEHNNPSKIYNFWMLHTNFSISFPVMNLLQKTDGVEGLDVFSRYRARIAFGQLFDDYEVRNKIEMSLCSPPVTPSVPIQLKTHLQAIKDEMKTKYKYWFIAVTEKDEIKLFGDDSKQKVEEKILEYPNAKICKSW